MQRVDEIAAASCKLKAAHSAALLHLQLSHGPHACTPFALDLSLRALPLPPDLTMCTLATARWTSTSEVPEVERVPAAGGAGELALIRGMHCDESISSEDTPVDTGALSPSSLAEAAGGGVVALSPRPVRCVDTHRATRRWIQQAHLVDRQAVECMPECTLTMHAAPRSVRAAAAGRAAQVAGSARWASAWSDGGYGAHAVRDLRKRGYAPVPTCRPFGTGAAVGHRVGARRPVVQASRVRGLTAEVRFVLRIV